MILVQACSPAPFPMELDISAGFDVTDIPAAVAQMGAGGATRHWWRRSFPRLSPIRTPPRRSLDLDAVLLGGGRPRPVLDAAAAAGVAVVRSYGSSETAGGCGLTVFPRRCVRPGGRASADGVGRIAIGGRHSPRDTEIRPIRSVRRSGWYCTDDIGGTVDDSGRIRVMGRSDDAISTGGRTVMPGVVEAVLAAIPPSRTSRCSGCPTTGSASRWWRHSC